MSEATTAKLTELLTLFLKSFKSKDGSFKYRERLSQLPSRGGKSLIVDFDDLNSYDIDLGLKLLTEPIETLNSFDKAAYEALRWENPSYADKIRKDLRVRIRNLPDKLSLRKLTTEHLGRLVAVSGMVIRASELKPLAMRVAFKCKKCGN
ncbi:MAG: hypothetical protein QW618_03015, partial [Nitrososphaerales archaeon]